VSGEHLKEHLDEWLFRFNRRSSRSWGLLFYRILQLGVGHSGIPYAELIADPADQPQRPPPIHGCGGSPPHTPHSRMSTPTGPGARSNSAELHTQKSTYAVADVLRVFEAQV